MAGDSYLSSLQTYAATKHAVDEITRHTADDRGDLRVKGAVVESLDHQERLLMTNGMPSQTADSKESTRFSLHTNISPETFSTCIGGVSCQNREMRYA